MSYLDGFVVPVRTANKESYRQVFFFNDTATTEIYTLSLHDALPISPALITCTCEATWFAIRWAAPLEECRTTTMSAYIAERLSTVSRRVSPLVEDDTTMFRLMTSADRRFAAISKVVRVRVEASKNRLNTDLPRRSGTFFTSRSVTPTKDAAVSRM